MRNLIPQMRRALTREARGFARGTPPKADLNSKRKGMGSKRPALGGVRGETPSVVAAAARV